MFKMTLERHCVCSELSWDFFLSSVAIWKFSAVSQLDTVEEAGVSDLRGRWWSMQICSQSEPPNKSLISFLQQPSRLQRDPLLYHRFDFIVNPCVLQTFYRANELLVQYNKVLHFLHSFLSHLFPSSTVCRCANTLASHISLVYHMWNESAHTSSLILKIFKID